MKFTYDAFDANGKPATGTVEAADLTEAVDALSRQGLYVARCKPEHEVAATAGSGGAAAAPAKGRSLGSRRLTRGRRLKNLAMFFRQLNVLVSSGTPLVQALNSLERQAREPAWRDVVATVRVKVEEGATLAAAMESSPQTFDAVCRSLIAAGESGGGFEGMLDRLATLTKKQMQLRSAIVGALIYPTLLIIIAVNVLCTMLLFVLPRFTGLFATLDVPLPPTTKFLMALSDALRNYWWAALFGIAATVGALYYWVRTPSGKHAVDTLMIKLPGVGPVVRSFATARITRVLGVLVNGKVPLLEALGLARQTVRNSHFTRLVSR